jgi:hypothetical protein
MEGLTAGEPLLLAVEEKSEEIGIGDLKAVEGEQVISLTGKDKPENGKVKVIVQLNPNEESPLKKTLLEKTSAQSDCPRCSYLEKISESQQNELLSLEEHKSTYADVKSIIKEYYSIDHIPYASKYIPDVEELGVDLPASYHGKTSAISKQEAEHLKEVIMGLTEKLKVLQVVQEEVKSLRQQLYDSHVNRLNLQTTIKENTEALELKCKEQCKKHIQINEERSKTMQGLLEQQHLFAQKSLELDQLKSDLSTLNATLQQLKAEEFNFNTMKDHVSRLDNELKQSTLKRDELIQEHQKTLSSFSEAKGKQLENISKLNNDKNSLLLIITQLESEISEQHDQNSSISKENRELERNISKLEEEIRDLSSNNKEIEQSRQIASEKEEECLRLHREIHEAAKKFEEQLEGLSKVNSQLLKEKFDVVESLNKLENTLEIKTEEVQDLTRNNYSSLAQCTILEQQVSIQDDQFEIQKAIESQQAANEKIKNILLEEISTMSDNLKKQSDECLGLSKNVENLKKELDSRNSVKKNIEKIVEGLKVVRKVYVPVRGEQIDELVAEVLNSRSDWIGIDVRRSYEGAYRFGAKEVGLFVEENCLMVRFGKAVMDIDEFLKVYIPLELHKQQLMKNEVVK